MIKKPSVRYELFLLELLASVIARVSINEIKHYKHKQHKELQKPSWISWPLHKKKKRFSTRLLPTISCQLVADAASWLQLNFI